MMSESELDELAADIKKNGLLEPVVMGWIPEMDAEGRSTGKGEYVLMDRRNRLTALQMIGNEIIQPRAKAHLDKDIWTTSPFSYDGSDEELIASANIHRRHLKPEQKRELIAKLLKADPAKSNRQIAEEMKPIKVDHKAVAAVRDQEESIGAIPQLTKTIGKDGKARPAKKPDTGLSLAKLRKKVSPKGAAAKDLLQSNPPASNVVKIPAAAKPRTPSRSPPCWCVILKLGRRLNRRSLKTYWRSTRS